MNKNMIEDELEKEKAKEEEKIIVPEYDFSLQHTKLHKNYKFAHSTLGKKLVNDETEHKDIIGGNVSICRNLLGLGSTIQRFKIDGERIELGLGEFSNHVWLPSYNNKEEDPLQKVLYQCINCGSLMINKKFYGFNILDKSK